MISWVTASAFNWVTVSALATAGGTLVLAVATFSSVRSANRAARTAERALLEGLRPVLVASRLTDPGEKFSFADGHWVRVLGGHGYVEVGDEVVYLAMALRNVGPGLAVLHGWTIGARVVDGTVGHQPPESFRRLTRDLYVPGGGDLGFWQGALRDPAEPVFAEVAELVRAGQGLSVELLYGDHEGGQRIITRFALMPVPEAAPPDGGEDAPAETTEAMGTTGTTEHTGTTRTTASAAGEAASAAQGSRWLAAASRHWNLDRSDPR